MPGIGGDVLPDQHVDLPLSDYDDKIEHFEQLMVVFMRGGVAICKTTLARALALEYNSHLDGPLAFALRTAREQNPTLVFDECHTIFPRAKLTSALTKNGFGSRVKVLFLSSSGDGASSLSTSVATPVEITHKFIWTPPLSYSPDLEQQLEEAGVQLDQESIQLFVRFWACHRSIFIAAMQWV